MPSCMATADIADLYGDQEQLASCDTQFTNYGGHTEFCGEIVTIKCFQDNGLVKKTLNSPGNGRVLVVDGHGGLHTALMGDMIAQAGVDNGWAGVVINGAIRDSAEVAKMPFGCKALGTNPRKSNKDGAGEVNVQVTFGGVVDTGGRHYEYEWTRPTHWVTDSEWEEEISRLSALAHPLRGDIMRRLLYAPATVAELVNEHIASSPGTAYHHVSALQAAGWVTKHDGSFAIPPARVIPLMVIITACEAH